MAELSTQGLDGLIDDMTALMELPDETVLEMLTAEAEVVAAAQQSEAQSMGVYATGKRRAVFHTTKIEGQGRKPRNLRFTERDAQRRKQAPQCRGRIRQRIRQGWTTRPPIHQHSKRKSADAAVEAAAGVYDKYLKSKNL